jgi:hypothetical protein
MRCAEGIVAAVSTLKPQYVRQTPRAPVERHREAILEQLRCTAARSILLLDEGDNLGGCNDSFRRKLAGVLGQFDDDSHWETFGARALSHEADGEFSEARELYLRAKAIVDADDRVRSDPRFQAVGRWLERRLARCVGLVASVAAFWSRDCSGREHLPPGSCLGKSCSQLVVVTRNRRTIIPARRLDARAAGS